MTVFKIRAALILQFCKKILYLPYLSIHRWNWFQHTAHKFYFQNYIVLYRFPWACRQIFHFKLKKNEQNMAFLMPFWWQSENGHDNGRHSGFVLRTNNFPIQGYHIKWRQNSNTDSYVTDVIESLFIRLGFNITVEIQKI